MTTTAATETGWVACDYSDDDTLARVRHAAVRESHADAMRDMREGGYDGVRYAHTDGYLYVDAQ